MSGKNVENNEEMERERVNKEERDQISIENLTPEE